MSERELVALLSGELLDDDTELTLPQLCRACQISAEQLKELVDHGIVEPLTRERRRWRFQAVSLSRVRCAVRLQRDLGVNLAGAALALDLLEELEALRTLVQRLSD